MNRSNMMRKLLFFFSFLACEESMGQVVLDADGPGGTYELISSVLAPGYDPIEVPDCNHMSFGDHIDEIFDEDLGTYVFRFHMHTSPDDDRCINFDRQRNEIKTYDKSPANLLGVEDEKINYKWKFKLSEGFQSSPNFTHLHQLKSVGGSLASMPMYTLTTRKGSPDQLELRYAETDDQVTLLKSDLDPFIGTWLEVSETIKYGLEGNYEIEIKRVDDGEILFTYTNSSIINWRPEATFVRPKWGIYRSLINQQDLRDETVLFNNFIIEELEISSSQNIKTEHDIPNIVFDPKVQAISIDRILPEIEKVQLYKLNGMLLLENSIGHNTSLKIDVANLSNGVYVIAFRGKKSIKSRLVFISNGG